MSRESTSTNETSMLSVYEAVACVKRMSFVGSASGIEHTTLGLNGGWIFFAINLHTDVRLGTSRILTLEQALTTHFTQSILAKNMCRLISSAPPAPSLRLGSRCSSSVIMLRAEDGMPEGNLSGSWRIFWYIAFVFLS